MERRIIYVRVLKGSSINDVTVLWGKGSRILKMTVFKSVTMGGGGGRG